MQYGVDRTYREAARLAAMSEGTLLTHLNRIRRNHPELYAHIRVVRKAQLAVRHEVALANARGHSRLYFRKRARWLRALGLWPGVIACAERTMTRIRGAPVALHSTAPRVAALISNPAATTESKSARAA